MEITNKSKEESDKELISHSSARVLDYTQKLGIDSSAIIEAAQKGIGEMECLENCTPKQIETKKIVGGCYKPKQFYGNGTEESAYQEIIPPQCTDKALQPVSTVKTPGQSDYLPFYGLGPLDADRLTRFVQQNCTKTAQDGADLYTCLERAAKK